LKSTYIPYRKRDFTRLRDTNQHHYYAGHGYAALRVDLRGSGDAIVRRVPRRDEIEALQKEVDGVLVMVWAKEGDRLSTFADTDSYSFEYANIFVGGGSEEELLKKYQLCMKRLSFEFESLTNLET
jgi:hypothetical protein